MEPPTQPPSAPVFAGVRITPDLLFRFGLLLLIALYLRTLRFEFVYDDLLIPLSPLIQSWHGVIDAFRSGIFGTQGHAVSSYYRPLPEVLGVVVARLTLATPGWYHLVALAIQVTLYVVCYRFSRLIFHCKWQAALTALLFILHPSKVETIAWIGGSFCDGQAAIYFFLVLICYMKWFATRNPVWIASSVAAFAASIFTKETMVLLPALLATHCWMNSETKPLRSSAVLMVPYAIVAGIFLLARHSALKPVAQNLNAIEPTFTIVNLWTAPASFWWHVGHLVLPLRCAILYDFSPVTRPTYTGFIVPFVGMCALLGLIAFVWRRTHSWEVIFFSAWFFITLAPVIAMAPSVTFHDRYLQLPSYPFCALLTFGFYWLWQHRPQLRWLSASLATLLVAAWAIGTWHESGYWRDSLSLWTRAVQVAPHNVNARVELARLYVNQDPSKLNQAIQVLDDGLRLLPDSPGLWRTRGLYQFNAGEFDNARISLLRSLEAANRYSALHNHIDPSDVRFGRASAEFFLGEIEMVKGNPVSADDWLRRALAIDPENLDYQQVMVKNLLKQGKTEEAAQHEQIAREIATRSTMKLSN